MSRTDLCWRDCKQIEDHTYIFWDWKQNQKHTGMVSIQKYLGISRELIYFVTHYFMLQKQSADGRVDQENIDR